MWAKGGECRKILLIAIEGNGGNQGIACEVFMKRRNLRKGGE